MKVLISIPTLPYGSIPWQLSGWIVHALQQGKRLGCSFVQRFIVGKQGVCSTRNRQVHDFLASDADVLLCIDDDAVPDLDGLALLMDAMKRPEVDIVCGWSLMQHDGESGGIPNIFSAHDEDANGRWLDPALAHGEPGLHDLRGGAVGTHVIAFKRKVAEAFKERGEVWFEDEYHKDTTLGTKFGCRRIGHDLNFFKRAQDMGFRAFLDNRVFWGHVKQTDLRDAYRQITALYDEIGAFRHIAGLLREDHGNTAWTAGPVFLMRMAYEAERLPEDRICVECGSGLTTRVLSRILPKHRLVTLEHSAEWFQHLHPSVNGSLTYAPLVDCGEYDWYRLPALPGRVGLVVCDGPPGSTRGGRYGALPELWEYLADDYTVLLDDATREGEKAIIDRWEQQFGPLKTATIPDDDGKSFAVLTGVTRHGERTVLRGSHPADVARDEHVHVHDRLDQPA